MEYENNNDSIKYLPDKIILMRDQIENMTKFNQIEILRILSEDKHVTINENKNGIYINMSDLSHTKLDELEQYITYVHTQESTLNDFEKQKESYKNTFFVKDNKDNLINNNK
jgi:hypothetical protein